MVWTGTGTPSTAGTGASSYATYTQIKAAAPGAFSGTTSDALLTTLAERASRLIDTLCRRIFYPLAATRYFDTNGELSLWIPDLLAVTSISTSSDYGVTYSALTSSDYVLYGGRELRAGETPYMRLDVATNGALACLEVGQKALKIVGTWGYHEDYANAYDGATWLPQPQVQQACIIQVLRWFKRGSQGYSDSGAVPTLGTMMYTQALDPDIVTLLVKTGLRRL